MSALVGSTPSERLRNLWAADRPGVIRKVVLFFATGVLLTASGVLGDAGLGDFGDFLIRGAIGFLLGAVWLDTPALGRSRPTLSRWSGTFGLLLGCAGLISAAHHSGSAVEPRLLFWLAVAALSLVATLTVSDLTNAKLRSGPVRRARDLAVPLLFGAFLFFLWEVIVVGAGVPAVLMPAPSAIAARFAASLPTLAADFRQTVVKGVLTGYALGCGAGFLVAILADRVPFLRRGLLPLGSFVSALPIIGIAPIMVMWFGFDWPSKAAVVAVMTFFPMLTNTVAGLDAAGRQERDLMRSYAAGYGETLVKLRLPMALPFVFNALKINSTLALIGAIVAEFFGTPVVGMGFRISIEAARLALDMVWAVIALAAIAGSLFYGLIALGERAATFWHPSYRA